MEGPFPEVQCDVVIVILARSSNREALPSAILTFADHQSGMMNGECSGAAHLGEQQQAD